MMAKVYLACPYSHNPVLGFIEASKAAARLMAAGNVVFSPISHSHPVAVHGKLDALDQGFWLRQDLPFLKDSEVLMVLQLPGWESSKGVRREIDYAGELQIPVVFMPWEEGKE